MSLAQGHNAVTPVKLKPVTLVLSQAIYHWATALPQFGDTVTTHPYTIPTMSWIEVCMIVECVQRENMAYLFEYPSKSSLKLKKYGVRATSRHFEF